MTNGPGKWDSPVVFADDIVVGFRAAKLWDRMRRLITRWLPLPTVCHPYPLRRMGVITYGKSRMR